MKVFNRLNIAVAAVRDMPADLQEAIDKNIGMRNFTKWLYSVSHRDLNELQMGRDAFTKSKKISSKDFSEATNSSNGKCMVIEIFKNGESQGIFAVYGYYIIYYNKGRQYQAYWVDNANLDVHSIRNLVRILKAEGITYIIWTIDLSKGKDTTDLKNQRREAQQGIIERYKDSWANKDKSGYEINRHKYRDMLRELKQAGNEYMDKIAKQSARFFDLQSKAAKAGKAEQVRWKSEYVIKSLAEALNEAVSSFANPKEIDKAINRLSGEIDNLEKYVNQ